MTTGNKSTDQRKPVSVLSDGVWITIYVGQTATKSWSGQDYSGSVPPPYTRRPFSLAQEPADPIHRDTYPKRIRGRDGRLPRRAYKEDHPYTMSGFEENQSHCVYRPSGGAIRQAASKSVGGTSVDGWRLTWDANDQIALIGRLTEAVAGSNFHLGVTLGEGGEAISMIRSSATRVHSALRALKRGNIPAMYKALTGTAQSQRYDRFRKDGYLHYDDFLKNERHRLEWIKWQNKKTAYDRDLSSIWLEAQYGWMPLLQDAKGAAEFLAERLERPDRHLVRARFKKSTNAPFATSTPTRTELLNCKEEMSRNVIARISTTNTAALTGMTDPLSVAWELTPWSFVVDWFVPIGDWLSAAQFSSKVSGSYVVSTRRRSTWQGFRLKRPQDIAIGGFSAAYERRTALTREIVSSLPVPLPRVKPLSEVLSWKRAANAVALLDTVRPREGLSNSSRGFPRIR